MKILILIPIILSTSLAAQPLPVAESSLKIGAMSEEVFYYGFAEGDQLHFTFQEVKGKELKELEIREVGGSSLFMDYKTKKTDKQVSITRTGIYQFRFANSALTGRVCKFKIQRTPATESSRRFNTSVYWRTQNDTLYIPETEQYLVKTDTLITVVKEATSKVSSQNALNGNTNKTIVDFTLPDGTDAWSYYIGVGREGQKEFDASREKFMQSAAASALKIPGYGPLAALAIQGINVFSKAGAGDNVKYFFITDWPNVQAFQSGQQFLQYKQGDVLNDAAQMKAPLSGKVYLGLLNDNVMDAIEVHVKITAVQFRNIWATRNIQRMQVTTQHIPYLKN